MLSLDQIRRELQAIESFDEAFLRANEHAREERIGYVIRQARKDELQKLAAAFAERN